MAAMTAGKHGAVGRFMVNQLKVKGTGSSPLDSLVGTKNSLDARYQYTIRADHRLHSPQNGFHQNVAFMPTDSAQKRRPAKIGLTTGYLYMNCSNSGNSCTVYTGAASSLPRTVSARRRLPLYTYKTGLAESPCEDLSAAYSRITSIT
jgi:hypothetical protein